MEQCLENLAAPEEPPVSLFHSRVGFKLRELHAQKVYPAYMRIAYINHGRFPTEKAHGFQIAQVCEATAALGHEVTLICPTLKNAVTADPRSYYGLRHPITVEYAGQYDAFQSPIIPGALAFITTLQFYKRALRLRLTPGRFDLLYTRSPFLLAALLKTHVPVILELHTLPRFFRRRFAASCNRCKKVVCLTGPMRQELVSWGVHAGKVIVEGDGVDLRRFEKLPDPSSAKVRWNLPADRPVIGYVGSLVTRETLEKGVRELIGASEKLKVKSEKWFLWIVGGPQKWIDIYRSHTSSSLELSSDQVRFQGHIDTADVPSAIAACDICVYPAPKTDHSYFMRDTSPLKLFEYLAAGRPIVCADLPPIRDVVDEKSVQFFRPGDAEDLAAAIEDVIAHPEAAQRRAEEGKRIVQQHSWEERMRRILS